MGRLWYIPAKLTRGMLLVHWKLAYISYWQGMFLMSRCRLRIGYQGGMNNNFSSLVETFVYSCKQFICSILLKQLIRAFEPISTHDWKCYYTSISILISITWPGMEKLKVVRIFHRIWFTGDKSQHHWSIRMICSHQIDIYLPQCKTFTSWGTNSSCPISHGRSFDQHHPRTLTLIL